MNLNINKGSKFLPKVFKSLQLWYWFFIIAAACFVRVYELQNYSFGDDEAWHLVIASQKNFWEVIKYNFSYEVHPPLSPIIWHFMLKVSNNDLWLRSASILTSILAIPSAFILGRLYIGRIAAVTMSIVMAFGALPIFLSSTIRAYSMLILVLIWIAISAFRYLKSRKRNDLILYIFCCLMAIELNHAAAFIVFTFGMILIFESLQKLKTNQKSAKSDFFLIVVSHLILAVLVIGYYYVLKYFDFKENDDRFTSVPIAYLINFSNLFGYTLFGYESIITQLALFLVIFFMPTLLVFKDRRLLWIIFSPVISVSLSDYFRYYPFSSEIRSNTFLIVSTLLSCGYLAQKILEPISKKINYNFRVCSKSLMPEISLGFLSFSLNKKIKILRIKFSQKLRGRNFEGCFVFLKLFNFLLVVMLILFFIYQNNFFRKNQPGCQEFSITKFDRKLLLEKLREKAKRGDVLVSNNTNIWKFQFEKGGDVKVITPNLAMFKNDEFVIYFSSFPEREKAANSSLEEYRLFFSDLFSYLNSIGSLQDDKKFTLFYSGLNNDYFNQIFSLSVKTDYTKTAMAKEDENLYLAIKNGKFSEEVFYFNDGSSSCSNLGVLVISPSKKSIEENIL